MTSITTLLKNALTLNCYLLTQTVFFYQIKSKYVDEEFFKYLFDFSNYPKDLKFFEPTNKKIIGKIKTKKKEK